MPRPASLEDLRHVRYLDALTDDEASALAAELPVRTVHAREFVFGAGDPPPGFYLLRSGKARIFRAGPEGREQILRLIEAGDTFGEVPIFDGESSPATVEALETCELILFPSARIHRVIVEHPEVGLGLLKHFALRLRGFTELVEQISLQTVPARLARYLYQLAREEGRRTPEGIVVPRDLTLQDLASLVGSVREVVSRTMRTFEQDGIVEVRRKEIVIRDLGGLKRLL